jgi:hypothetical protein
MVLARSDVLFFLLGFWISSRSDGSFWTISKILEDFLVGGKYSVFLRLFFGFAAGSFGSSFCQQF